MPEQDNFINRPFQAQLRGYYAQYLQEKEEILMGGINDPMAMLAFTSEVNVLIRRAQDNARAAAAMAKAKDARPNAAKAHTNGQAAKAHVNGTALETKPEEKEPDYQISPIQFKEMLNGVRLPNAMQAEAIATELSRCISLFREARNDFMAASQSLSHGRAIPAVPHDSDTNARERLVELATAAVTTQELRIKTDQERIRQRNTQVTQWRGLNPRGREKLASFAEIIEDSYKKGLRFNTFLKHLLEVEWKMSAEAFCDGMEWLNHKKSDRELARRGVFKRTLTNTILYHWMNHPDSVPNTESVQLLRETFGLDEAHELMLWQIIGGKKLELDAKIAEATTKEKRGELVQALVEASGIPDRHIKDKVGVGQLPAWKRGAIIQEKAAARRFVDLLQPDINPDDKKAPMRHQQLMGLLTQRPQTVDEALETAREQPHPGGALFLQLTGRYGLVTISDDDLAKGLSTKAKPVSTHKIGKMRRSTELERGGYINETHAKKILALMQKRLRQEGSSLEVTPRAQEECLEMMTGIPAIHTLLQLGRDDDLFAGEILRMTRERRGLTQAQAEKQIGLTNLSNFELGKNSLQHESARKVAAWLGLEGDDARDFVVMATSRKADYTPLELLEKAKDPKQRCRCLQRLFDGTGLTREELADRSGIDFGRIMYANQQRSGGHIIADDDAMATLAALCGVGEQAKAFIDTFASPWAERVAEPAGTTSTALRRQAPARRS